MRKSRFTEAKTVAILREANKNPLAEIAKKHDLWHSQLLGQI